MSISNREVAEQFMDQVREEVDIGNPVRFNNYILHKKDNLFLVYKTESDTILHKDELLCNSLIFILEKNKEDFENNKLDVKENNWFRKVWFNIRNFFLGFASQKYVAITQDDLVDGLKQLRIKEQWNNI